MKTVSDILETLGPLAVVSKHFGFKNTSTVSQWKRTNSVRVNYWPGLIDLSKKVAKETGDKSVVLTHEIIANAHLAKKEDA